MSLNGNAENSNILKGKILSFASVDKTLTKDGSPADAKVVGDAIRALQDGVGGSGGTAIYSHLESITNPHKVTARQVGLGNVDNTSDMDKPISTAQAAVNAEVASSLDYAIRFARTANENAVSAIDAASAHKNDKANPHRVTAEQAGAIPASDKGVSVATLNENGKVPAEQTCSQVVVVPNVYKYQLTAADAGKFLIFETSGTVTEVTVTLPTNEENANIPIGTEFTVSKWNKGLAVWFLCYEGQTIRTTDINEVGGFTEISKSYGVVTFKKISDTKWFALGDIVESK